MNLIFMYGPPASGKLTIAKELAELTGYSLFHNHQTRDMVHGMYPTSLKENYGLVHILRLDIFRYAAQHDTNLIFTFVYDSPDDITFVQQVIDTVEAEGGKVRFVETTASKDVLLDRVDNDSRKEHRKLTDKSILEEQIDEGRFESLPYDNICKIDTGASDPAKSAAMIADFFTFAK
jgi:tRNA uridine 5-carbamoylmethylation protein Kti12